jgi:hypothetical protein
MANGPKLDGAGLAKMATLDEATAAVQRLHGIVERMAIAVRSQQNTAQFGAQIRRAGAPLVGLLKGQFGMISDQVSTLLLVATRGGGDQAKLRSLRETVAQIRIQLEIAVARTKEKHAVEEDVAGN